MTHPHEFASGAFTLTMLGQLFDALAAASFSPINVRGLVEELKSSSRTPTQAPTTVHVISPTQHPTAAHISNPSFAPTRNPTINHVISPTQHPTRPPTRNPTRHPVRNPTARPTFRRFNNCFIFFFNPFLSLFGHHKTQAMTTNIRGYTTASSTPANVLSYLLDNNIAVSVGVDASTINTQDANYLSAVKRCAATGSSNCELYVQGSVTASTQGNVGSADEVKAQLQTADDQIKALIPGFAPEVYVPYQNSANENVIAAAKAVGFAAIASTDSSLAWDLNASPMQMSPQTSTGVQDDNGAWQANPTDKIVSDCSAAADRGEVCVIQLTANEFASGAYSTEKVQELVAGLNAAGFTDSITFHTVISALQANSPSTAPTQGPLASSDSNGDVVSYLTSPATYIIAAITTVLLVTIAGIAYLAYSYSRRSDDKKQKLGNADLETVSIDSLMDFSVEQNEDKTPPSSLRISIQYDQLAALSPANSPMAVTRSVGGSPSSVEEMQQVELV